MINQLSRKIDVYERLHALFPGYAGFLASFNTGTMSFTYNQINVDENSLIIWPMIAVYQQLRVFNQVLAVRYKNFVDRISDNVATVFYNNDANGLWRHAKVLNASIAQPTRANFEQGGEMWYQTRDDLCIMFSYLYGNWSLFDDDSARAKLWEQTYVHVVAIDYSIGDDTLEVERGGPRFASAERIKYLMLPYHDVPIDERLFRNGESARTHYSSVNGIAGLMSDTFLYDIPYNYNLDRQSCGIKVRTATATSTGWAK